MGSLKVVMQQLQPNILCLFGRCLGRQQKLSKGGAEGTSTSKPGATTNPTQLFCIDKLQAAKAKYTAKSLFIYDRVRQRSLEDEAVAYCIDQKEKQHIYREEK
jgi:hypothetical protein